MAKEQDQTQETEDKANVVETKEDTSTPKEAIKTSEDFDKLLDENPEDVEETPPEEKDDEKKESKDSKKPEDKAKADADDKNAGEDKDEGSDKKADDKDADDKAGTELTKRATDLGLTKEEIGQFEDDAALETYVKSVEDVVAAVEEKEAVKQADSAHKPAEKKDDAKEDTGIKFENESDIDPEVLKSIRAVEQQNKDLREKVVKLETTFEREQTARQQESQRQFTKRFDGMVDKLGLDFADVFGKGKLNDLNKSSKAYQNRDAIRGRMYAFGQGFIAANEAIPDEQKLFDMALSSLHDDKVKRTSGLRLKEKTDKHAKSARVGRASTKKTGKLTGQQKAVNTSKEFDELIDTTED